MVTMRLLPPPPPPATILKRRTSVHIVPRLARKKPAQLSPGIDTGCTERSFHIGVNTTESCYVHNKTVKHKKANTQQTQRQTDFCYISTNAKNGERRTKIASYREKLRIRMDKSQKTLHFWGLMTEKYSYCLSYLNF